MPDDTKDLPETIKLYWIDPRTEPEPPAPSSKSPPASDPTEIAPLMKLCRIGRIYEVERRIVQGKPLQVAHLPKITPRSSRTPLEIAIDTGQQDLALLLLCNGYQPHLEPEISINRALRKKCWGIVRLLIHWGVDPRQVDPHTVLDSYDRDMIELFWEAGVDYTQDGLLATYLAFTGSNRPLYGWIRRHRDEPRIASAMIQALLKAFLEDHDRAACMLLWAGADPHRLCPPEDFGLDEENENEPRTALEQAVCYGKGKYLKNIMRLDPTRDDLERVSRFICDGEAVDALIAVWPSGDWSQAINHNIRRMSYGLSQWESQSKKCLERIEFHGGRLSFISSEEIRSLRRDMLNFRYGSQLCHVVELLAEEKFCEPAIFQELMKTGSIRGKLERESVWVPKNLIKRINSINDKTKK